VSVTQFQNFIYQQKGWAVWKYPNEAARHKLLDVIGDLALVGCRIRGKVIANKPGHGTNTSFAKKLAKIIKQERRNRVPEFDLNTEPLMDVNAIMRVLPHRPPFLLVDKILELSDTHIVGMKSITMNEPYFAGHFPGQPVMPGVLIVEAFGQAAAALTAHGIDKETYENKLVFLMSVEKARFRNPVLPDCELHLDIQAVRSHGRVWKYKGVAKVNGKIMADAQWSATIVDRNK
jgi:UDP-3-O-[3-hydroxymyristoyl] N-acetylglucosamine deacetylase/3-hydroxyacyl-[acyl-carrier-protein] dehydratase